MVGDHFGHAGRGAAIDHVTEAYGLRGNEFANAPNLVFGKGCRRRERLAGRDLDGEGAVGVGGYADVGQARGEKGGGGEFGGGVGGGYGDRAHAGGSRSGEAGGGVFDYDTVCGDAAETSGGEQVGFGAGLAVDDIFRRHQDLGRWEAAVLKDDAGQRPGSRR